MANRMRMVLDGVISDSQSAFLKGRFILDGPLIVNELISWIKKNKKKGFFLKINFEKAYDNVNWKFVISILSQIGFPELWCKWTLVPKNADLIKGISTPFDGPNISHLPYADDSIVMGEWDKQEVVNIVRVLRVFFICSGLKTNIDKSNLYGIGVGTENIIDMANVVGCRPDYFPFKYLGLTVRANMNRIVNWSPVYDIFRNWLARWKSQLLSIGGRVVIIKSVLESLSCYYFSLYKAPKKVISDLESMIKKFLWGGSSEEKKMHWINWDRVSSPKKMEV
ncbi:uncharacterized protein LOC110901755 [Helianthus annuus]|uniref:uncharacterized protein LOC110901755 n=1 Tax=Helianthus annuus TaxID=4232 RepID=UPI000B9089FB|nr:uncharacterized protein LOC110901755 [Helianthus annuus]